jgi:DNA-binding HxlR family transcriptional regulator
VFVLGRTYEGQNCSIARALEVVGERWTLLIVREVFNGTHRFDDLRRRLGVARNVLSARLEHLVGQGVLERVPYSERPLRCEYHPTPMGRDLLPVILALMAWGDRYLTDPDDGPPVVFTHDPCGRDLVTRTVCSCCGAPLALEQLTARVDHAG